MSCVTSAHGRPLKVLVMSRNYPNNVMEILGLWVERLVRQSASFCEPKVIAPVPYIPPFPWLGEYYSRFRRIDAHRWADSVEISHPRFFVGPGYSLHSVEWVTYYLGVRRCVDQLHRRFPFDLIHAHFTYPDGVVAARLGRRYGVPVIITEQVPWRPWLEHYPVVRRQATWAARQSTFHIAISRSVRDSITHFTKDASNLRIIPDGVDGSVFTMPQNGRRFISNQILFVGATRPVKGVDILLKAVRLLVDRKCDVKLVIVGEGYYRSYRREYDRLQQMARDLTIQGYVEFAGKKSVSDLVRYMQESAILVLPSRAESLGMVLAEALACGTPVVSTRSGGPEDIVNEKVGVLVPVEDPGALARGIEEVLRRRGDYDPVKLRSYALDNFGLESIGRRMSDLYQEALNCYRR